MNQEDPQQPQILSPEQAELLANTFEKEGANPIDLAKRKSSGERRAELVYMLTATGITRNNIALQLDCTPQTVTNYLSEPIADSRIDYHRERLYGRSLKKRMEAMAHKALDRVEKTIDDEGTKPETKLSAATYILDHSIGKPKQTVEHQGNILGEIMDRINSSRIVQEISESLASQKDDLDNFAEDYAPKHVVGVRSNGKEGQQSE